MDYYDYSLYDVRICDRIYIIPQWIHWAHFFGGRLLLHKSHRDFAVRPLSPHWSGQSLRDFDLGTLPTALNDGDKEGLCVTVMAMAISD